MLLHTCLPIFDSLFRFWMQFTLESRQLAYKIAYKIEKNCHSSFQIPRLFLPATEYIRTNTYYIFHQKYINVLLIITVKYLIWNICFILFNCISPSTYQISSFRNCKISSCLFKLFIGFCLTRCLLLSQILIFYHCTKTLC